MKKYILILALVACQKEIGFNNDRRVSILGTWKFVSFKEGQFEQSSFDACEGKNTLTFREDSTAVYIKEECGLYEREIGRWTLVGDILSFEGRARKAVLTDSTLRFGEYGGDKNYEYKFRR